MINSRIYIYIHIRKVEKKKKGTGLYLKKGYVCGGVRY